jgi:hypothetical protein
MASKGKMADSIHLIPAERITQDILIIRVLAPIEL